MTRLAVIITLALTTTPLAAQDGPQPYLNEGETIETELRTDLNADGTPDLAYVAAREDRRELRVATSYVNETGFGENPIQTLALEAYPLGDADLVVKDNPKGKVLVLVELTGGTTAVASTHRFRWDAKLGALGAMRLIGLDATLYSRTFAHDGQEASWNLLTGELVTRRLKLQTGRSDPAYSKVGERRSKKPSPPLALDKSPSGDDLLGWPLAGPER